VPSGVALLVVSLVLLPALVTCLSSAISILVVTPMVVGMFVGAAVIWIGAGPAAARAPGSRSRRTRPG
jgi:hypothetical protein